MSGANMFHRNMAAGEDRSRKYRVCVHLALTALAGIAVFCEPDTAYAQNHSSNKSSILDGIVVEKIGPFLYDVLLDRAVAYDGDESSNLYLYQSTMIMYADMAYFNNSQDNMKKYLDNKYGAKYIPVESRRPRVVQDISFNQLSAHVPHNIISDYVPCDIPATDSLVHTIPYSSFNQLSAHVPYAIVVASVPFDMISALSHEPAFIHMGLHYISYPILENYERKKPTIYNKILDAVEWMAITGYSVTEINTASDDSRTCTNANDIAVFVMVLSAPIIVVCLTFFRHKLPGSKTKRAESKS